jgi:hypothetical protein
MRSQTTTPFPKNRASEKGAALITTVLLSFLLLAAGGTLILVTTMAGITARDSTAEMQAYYAAEAGIARNLEVLRGNLDSNPTGTRASFHNILCTPSLWTSTAGGAVNVATDGSSQFQTVSIFDPDNKVYSPLDPADAYSTTKCADASYKPDRLRIRVLGTGPKNSQKKMEIVVNRYTVSYDVNAVVTLPNGSGNPISFALGGSNVTSTSGTDSSGSGNTLAAYAVSNTDYNATNNVIDGCQPDGTNCGGSGPNVYPGDPAVLSAPNTPSFLQSVASARTFLDGSEGMKNTAINQGRYFTDGTSAINSSAGIGASNPDGVLTFVDGDFVLGPGNPSGQGTLIVTGHLTLNGNFNFNGVIMVLGNGTVSRTGGGNGNIYGAIYVAKFARTGADTDVFQAPTFDTSGGGNANIQYSSDAVDKAKAVGGHTIKGVREY